MRNCKKLYLKYHGIPSLINGYDYDDDDELSHEKTCYLHVRKQRCRSGAPLPRS